VLLWSSTEGDWLKSSRELLTPRSGHACAYWPERNAIVITGGMNQMAAILEDNEIPGVDDDEKVVDSTEMLSLSSDDDIKPFASMASARTAHAMAVIRNVPVVMGGLNEQAFLSSIERLTVTSIDDQLLTVEWTLTPFSLLKPRYTAAVFLLPVSLLKACSKDVS